MTAYTTAFDDHPRYRREDGDGFDLDGIDFEAWVRIDEAGVVLVSSLPTLDATVTGERVAPVVADGWFEAFERRVEDAHLVTDGDVGEPTVSREGTTIRVETPIRSDPDAAPDDALAVANYLEGTWVEGIIPGYEYDERVSTIRDRGREYANDG